MSGHRSYVRVALPLPLDQTFTYAVDGGPVRSGTRVLVPFQRQERIGFVVGQGGDEGLKRIRSVLSVMDTEPSVSESQLRLARWMADYYVTSLGIVLKTMLPSVLTDTSRDVVTLHNGPRRKLSLRGGAPRRGADTRSITFSPGAQAGSADGLHMAGDTCPHRSGGD